MQIPVIHTAKTIAQLRRAIADLPDEMLCRQSHYEGSVEIFRELDFTVRPLVHAQSPLEFRDPKDGRDPLAVVKQVLVFG